MRRKESTNEMMHRLQQQGREIGPCYPVGMFRIHDPRREEAEQTSAFPLDHIEHTNS